MILADVNILIYAFRRDVAGHDGYKRWLENAINGSEALGVSDQVLSSFLRVVTNPRTFGTASTLEKALVFADRLRSAPNRVDIAPGPRHWEIFSKLCREAGARGNLVQDAWFAALAIESGSEWITDDRDYARFPGLRWRHPLAPRRS